MWLYVSIIDTHDVSSNLWAHAHFNEFKAYIAQKDMNDMVHST